MEDKTYTVLDLAEIFGKDKQLIRRRIIKLKLVAINKNTREHINEALIYNHDAYIALANELGKLDIKNDNTYETRNDMRGNTDKLNRDRLIEILERELKYSKDKLEKAEQEKESLYRLLSQQQQLSLNDKNKIKILELEIEEIKEPKVDEEAEQEKNFKWYNIFRNIRNRG